jgi:DNA-binding NarL/FixJ family response regulator
MRFKVALADFSLLTANQHERLGRDASAASSRRPEWPYNDCQTAPTCPHLPLGPHARSTSMEPVHALLVVSPSTTHREAVRHALHDHPGFRLHFVETAKEALRVAETLGIALVLTSLKLDGDDGLELVKLMRKQHPLIPVILMTEEGSDELAFRALKAGAANYVPVRSLLEDLRGTLESVLAAAEVDRRRACLMRSLTQSQLEFTIGNDPTLIPCIVQMFQENVTGMGICDETTCIRLGIALEEAILNAMYHGNLEVSSELRRDGDQPYRDLIEQRKRQKPYCERTVTIRATLSRDEAVYVIQDQGPGFDPSKLPDPTDPANLESTSGRGLLLIRTFMDEVRHNQTGNEIMMKLRRKPCAMNKT